MDPAAQMYFSDTDTDDDDLFTHMEAQCKNASQADEILYSENIGTPWVQCDKCQHWAVVGHYAEDRKTSIETWKCIQAYDLPYLCVKCRDTTNCATCDAPLLDVRKVCHDAEDETKFVCYKCHQKQVVIEDSDIPVEPLSNMFFAVDYEEETVCCVSCKKDISNDAVTVNTKDGISCFSCESKRRKEGEAEQHSVIADSELCESELEFDDASTPNTPMSDNVEPPSPTPAVAATKSNSLLAALGMCRTSTPIEVRAPALQKEQCRVEFVCLEPKKRQTLMGQQRNPLQKNTKERTNWTAVMEQGGTVAQRMRDFEQAQRKHRTKLPETKLSREPFTKDDTIVDVNFCGTNFVTESGKLIPWDSLFFNTGLIPEGAIGMFCDSQMVHYFRFVSSGYVYLGHCHYSITNVRGVSKYIICQFKRELPRNNLKFDYASVPHSGVWHYLPSLVSAACYTSCSSPYNNVYYYHGPTSQDDSVVISTEFIADSLVASPNWNKMENMRLSFCDAVVRHNEALDEPEYNTIAHYVVRVAIHLSSPPATPVRLLKVDMDADIGSWYLASYPVRLVTDRHVVKNRESAKFFRFFPHHTAGVHGSLTQTSADGVRGWLKKWEDCKKWHALDDTWALCKFVGPDLSPCLNAAKEEHIHPDFTRPYVTSVSDMSRMLACPVAAKRRNRQKDNQASITDFGRVEKRARTEEESSTDINEILRRSLDESVSGDTPNAFPFPSLDNIDWSDLVNWDVGAAIGLIDSSQEYPPKIAADLQGLNLCDAVDPIPFLFPISHEKQTPDIPGSMSIDPRHIQLDQTLPLDGFNPLYFPFVNASSDVRLHSV